MFHHEPWSPFSKQQEIRDDASDVVLYLDTDDVNPDEVSEHTAERICTALNDHFYRFETRRH